MFMPRISMPDVKSIVPTIGAPEVVASWRKQADSGTLTLGHPHLFFGHGAVTLDGHRETKSESQRDAEFERKYGHLPRRGR